MFYKRYKGNISISHVFQVMTEFSSEEQRSFLKFVTGCPKLPVGGFDHMFYKSYHTFMYNLRLVLAHLTKKASEKNYETKIIAKFSL